MIAYELAEQMAEALAQRTDIDDMVAPDPEDVEDGTEEGRVSFSVTIDGVRYRVSVEAEE